MPRDLGITMPKGYPIDSLCIVTCTHGLDTDVVEIGAIVKVIGDPVMNIAPEDRRWMQPIDPDTTKNPRLAHRCMREDPSWAPAWYIDWMRPFEDPDATDTTLEKEREHEASM